MKIGNGRIEDMEESCYLCSCITKDGQEIKIRTVQATQPSAKKIPY